MQTFVSVAGHGSFAKAAKELGVSRALVSKRVQVLESALRLKLIVRDTHRTSMTAAGREYFRGCKAILQMMAELEDTTTQTQGQPRGEITVLTSKTFGETVLASLVATFCSQYPDVGVNLSLKDLHTHAEELISGGYDIAVTVLPNKDSTLKVRKLVSMPCQLVAAPSYLATHGAPKSPSELVQFNCLDPRGQAQSIWRFHAGSTVHRVQVSGTPRSNSSSIVCQLALKGLGLALLRSYFIHDHLAQGRLIPVIERFKPESQQLYLMYQRDRFLPHRTRLFIDHLCRNVAFATDPGQWFSAARPGL